MSETRAVTRVAEKRELGELNTRLETYVTHTKTIHIEYERIREELRLAKLRLDTLRKEKDDLYARDTAALHKQIATLTKKLSRATSTISDLEARIKEMEPFEGEVKGLRTDLASLQSRYTELQKEYDALKGRSGKWEGEIETLRRTLRQTEETSADAESRLGVVTKERDSLRKELTQRNNEWEAEVERIQRESHEFLMTCRTEWQETSQSKLKALEDKLKRNWETATKDLRDRVEELEQANDRLSVTQTSAKEEVTEKAKVITEMTVRLQATETRAQKQIETLQGSIVDAERRLGNERSARGKLQDEFNKLMDVKISLQAELDHYRKILDAEERRHGLTPGTSRSRSRFINDVSGGGGGGSGEDGSATAVSAALEAEGERMDMERSTKTVTKVTETRTKRRRKRARMESTVIIESLDLEGDSVTVLNVCDTNISMKDWKLESLEGSQVFNFPDELELPPNARVTVWSGKKNYRRRKQLPAPRNLIWTKRYMWNDKGDTAVLVDPEDNRVSTVECVPDAEVRSVGIARRRTTSITPETDCISVVNRKDYPQSLKGWTLESELATGPDKVYNFPDITLTPGETITIWSGKDSKALAAETDLVWTDQLMWTHEGDFAILRNADNEEVTRAGSAPSDKPGQCTFM